MLPGGGFYWLKNRTRYPLECQSRNIWSTLQILVLIKFKVEMCLHKKSEIGYGVSAIKKERGNDFANKVTNKKKLKGPL